MDAVPRRAALLAGSRYELLVKVATGGTATVYVGRVLGSVGFSRLVAIKRAHPHLRDDPTARAALVREATLASRVHHANVVPIQDVEQTEDELLLVMDYIEGGALSELLEKQSGPPNVSIMLRILLDACAGLGAVHGQRADDGRDLGMIHRDVSPQNILVGLDGTARLTDFGLARLTEVSASATATVKGKIAYMAPEYIEGAPPTRQCDVFSMGVVAWEALSGRRLFRGSNDADTLRRVVSQPVPRLSSVADVPEPFDAVLARALSKDPLMRFRSIAAFTESLTDVARMVGVAPAHRVGELVRGLVGNTLNRRRETVRMMADPENATGSMLLDDLPFDVKSGPPDSLHHATSQPPPRPVEPTLPLDADENPEEETLRQPSRPRASSPSAASTSTSAEVTPLPAIGRDPPQLVFLAPPLAAAIAVLAFLAWPSDDDPATWEPATRTAAETHLTAAAAPPTPTPSPASADASSETTDPEAPEPTPLHGPRPPRPAGLPKNPYEKRR